MEPLASRLSNPPVPALLASTISRGWVGYWIVYRTKTDGHATVFKPARTSLALRRNHQTSSVLVPGMALTGRMEDRLAASNPAVKGFL